MSNHLSNHRREKTLLAAASLVVTGWLPTGAYAQAQQSVGNAIEEVLVTARRREESLQDVPIAISAFAGENLAERGVQTVGQMNAVAPNLSVMGGGATGEGQATFRVRGLPGVAIYVDGVNQASAPTSTQGLFTMGVVEVERMEVLRGPQGTLFGNASTGGAISYVTRAPADTFGVRVEGSVGSFNRRDFQTAVDLPLGETFKSKFTMSSQARDGFLRSVTGNRSYGDVNDELLRADFLWTPIDSVSVRYNTEVTNTDRVGPARVVWEIGPTTEFTVGPRMYNTSPNTQAYENLGIFYNTANNVSGQGGALGKYETRVNWETNGLVIDMMRHTLDATWTINDTFRTRAISGYKELESATETDYDGASEVILLERDFRVRNYNFTQELQLLGSHERVDWVLGGYYSQESNRTRTIGWNLPTFTCDIWTPANLQRVGDAERAQCFNTRARAVGSSLRAPEGATAAQIATLGTQLAAGNFNLNGVTPATFTGVAPSNSDSMTLSQPETTAVFGDLTWRLTDQLTVAAGLRYSKDENPGQYTFASNANLASRATVLPDNNINNVFGFLEPLPARSAPTKFSALTKRLTVQYSWTPDIMTYVSYADGYQPGGSQLTQASILDYMARLPAGLVSDIPAAVVRDEETVDNYEVGLRADWLGGVVRTNLTAFYTDWQNVPVAGYVATQFWDTNADGAPDGTIDVDGRPGNDVFYFPSTWNVAATKAEAKGIEFEAIWRATDALRFDLNLGYLKTEYKELGQAGRGAAPAVSPGSPFPQAPELTGNLATQYEIALAGGASITPRLDYTYTDDYVLQTTELFQRTQEGFGLLNARIGYDSGNNWRVALTGSNLTNEYYFNSGFYTRAEQFHFLTLGRPREWGLTFNWRFE